MYRSSLTTDDYSKFFKIKIFSNKLSCPKDCPWSIFPSTTVSVSPIIITNIMIIITIIVVVYQTFCKCLLMASKDYLLCNPLFGTEKSSSFSQEESKVESSATFLVAYIWIILSQQKDTTKSKSKSKKFIVVFPFKVNNFLENRVSHFKNS